MRRIISLALVAIALAVGGCGGAASTPAASTGAGTPAPTMAGGAPRISGTVTAGPVCPVEQNPPDPACAPRPVAGAVIVATNSNGDEVGRTISGDDGAYELLVNQTGTLTVTGEPVEGYMGAPKPETVQVDAPGQVVQLDLAYDTGIR